MSLEIFLPIDVKKLLKWLAYVCHRCIIIVCHVQLHYSCLPKLPLLPKFGGGGRGRWVEWSWRMSNYTLFYSFWGGGEGKGQACSCTIAADSIRRATFKTVRFQIVFCKLYFSLGQDTLRLIVTKFADSHYLIDVHHPQVRQVSHSQL